MTRGYQNNNPGNIIKGGKPFLGEIPGKDEKFRSFQSMEFGYRAIFKILRTYIKSGYNTIDKIINRYAPASENDTATYIRNVVSFTGIKKDTLVDMDDSEKMIRIVTAISNQENGIKPDTQQVVKGWNLLDEVKKK
jgi:hypothetical protein